MTLASAWTNAMRATALAAVLTACGLGGLPSEILTCAPPIEEGLCRDIGAFALAGVDVDRESLGEVKEVAVTEVTDCAALGRAIFEMRLADPAIAACWEVQLSWQRGGGTWVVVRNATDGQVRLLD